MHTILKHMFHFKVRTHKLMSSSRLEMSHSDKYWKHNHSSQSSERIIPLSRQNGSFLSVVRADHSSQSSERIILLSRQNGSLLSVVRAYHSSQSSERIIPLSRQSGSLLSSCVSSVVRPSRPSPHTSPPSSSSSSSSFSSSSSPLTSRCADSSDSSPVPASS